MWWLLLQYPMPIYSFYIISYLCILFDDTVHKWFHMYIYCEREHHRSFKSWLYPRCVRSFFLYHPHIIYTAPWKNPKTFIIVCRAQSFLQQLNKHTHIMYMYMHAQTHAHTVGPTLRRILSHIYTHSISLAL